MGDLINDREGGILQFSLIPPFCYFSKLENFISSIQPRHLLKKYVTPIWQWRIVKNGIFYVV